MAWNCEGTRLASGSYDKTVTLWSLDADKLVCNWVYTLRLSLSLSLSLSRTMKATTRFILAVWISCAGIQGRRTCLRLLRPTRLSVFGTPDVKQRPNASSNSIHTVSMRIISLSLSLSLLAGKVTSTVHTKGENINICWSPDGNNIAVGNKVTSPLHHHHSHTHQLKSYFSPG